MGDLPSSCLFAMSLGQISMLVCSYNEDQRTWILHVEVHPTRTIPLAEKQLREPAAAGNSLVWD
jgi:hypothetical protein